MAMQSDGKRLYTHSASESFRTCDYLYKIQYVDGYRPVSMAKPLWFGILIHRALEAYWLARKAGIADPVGRALDEIPGADKMDPFERAKARVMIIAYGAVWGTTQCDVLAVEAKFVTPLLHPVTYRAHPRFDRAGKIDLILRLTDGRITVVEHKTSALDVGPGSDYRRRLPLDEQISFYYAGAISLGFRPDVVIYDVLCKFDEKPRMATPEEKRVMVKDRKTKEVRLKKGQRDRDETPDEYERRLAEAVAKAPGDHIERVEVYRLPHERKRFALDVWNQAEKMTHTIDGDLFVRNSRACFRYGSPCGFVEHCLENRPLADTMTFRKLKHIHPELEEGSGT